MIEIKLPSHTYESSIEKQAYQNGRADEKAAIIEYVKTDAFKEAWIRAKGVPFGDFLAELLKEH